MELLLNVLLQRFRISVHSVVRSRRAAQSGSRALLRGLIIRANSHYALLPCSVVLYPSTVVLQHPHATGCDHIVPSPSILMSSQCNFASRKSSLTWHDGTKSMTFIVRFIWSQLECAETHPSYMSCRFINYAMQRC